MEKWFRGAPRWLVVFRTYVKVRGGFDSEPNTGEVGPLPEAVAEVGKQRRDLRLQRCVGCEHQGLDCEEWVNVGFRLRRASKAEG